jgi:hypothetical protein
MPFGSPGISRSVVVDAVLDAVLDVVLDIVNQSIGMFRVARKEAVLHLENESCTAASLVTPGPPDLFGAADRGRRHDARRLLDNGARRRLVPNKITRSWAGVAVSANPRSAEAPGPVQPANHDRASDG